MTKKSETSEKKDLAKETGAPLGKARVEIPEPPQKQANIYAALSAFQGELKPMAKTGKVEFATKSGSGKVSFNYTPLGEIMTIIYPLLAKHGLSVRHEITDKGVEAILTHETYKQPAPMFITDNGSVKVTAEGGGVAMSEPNHQIIKFDMPVENEIRSGLVKVGQAGEMKDVGAAITYARRYTLTMVLGISSEDDKDAELLEQSAKNAVQTVFDRFGAGLKASKTSEEVEKSMAVLKKDMAALDAGKAPSLGLSKDQYQDLIALGNARIEELTS